MEKKVQKLNIKQILTIALVILALVTLYVAVDCGVTAYAYASGYPRNVDKPLTTSSSYNGDYVKAVIYYKFSNKVSTSKSLTAQAWCGYESASVAKFNDGKLMMVSNQKFNTDNTAGRYYNDVQAISYFNKSVSDTRVYIITDNMKYIKSSAEIVYNNNQYSIFVRYID